MTVKDQSGKLLTINPKRWAICPACGKGKLIRILPNSRASNLELFCKVCKHTTIVHISP